jgi:hypothetical protein
VASVLSGTVGLSSAGGLFESGLAGMAWQLVLLSIGSAARFGRARRARLARFILKMEMLLGGANRPPDSSRFAQR